MLKRYTEYGWTKKAICQKWDISVQTLYRIDPDIIKMSPSNRIQLNTITLEEQLAVREYALTHTELRHREIAYRMIDENVAFMSPSSVYRIFSKYNLICTRSKKEKPGVWNPHSKVNEPDQGWQTDLTYLQYYSREYYLLSYMDVYSRFIVFHKLLLNMTGQTIRDATEEAILRTGIIPGSVQSDNGSCYISQEYRSLIGTLNIEHRFIHAHCPNENAEIERYHRTLKESLDPHDAENFAHLSKLLTERIRYYNYERYHSRIGFIPPHVKYRGKPEIIFETRRKKLERAKEKRIKYNLNKKIKQSALNINFSRCKNFV